MPEQEFEIYLALLSKLLRLSPTQKAAISDELRDHLEQRLSDLMQGGMTREAAINAAVDEFGDVTGLALDLTRVSRSPVKKVVVGSTLVASAVAVGIVCWLGLFAPQDRLAAPEALQAQQIPPDANQNGDRNIPSQYLNDEVLFPTFLSKTIDVSFEETPLGEVCAFLSDAHKVPVMLHRVSLDEAGLSANTPVSLTLQGITLEEVLDHLTRKLHLTWEIESGGVIRILTRDDDSLKRFRTRHYDMQPLIKNGIAIRSVEELLKLEGEWEGDQGSYGTIAWLGNSAIIRQKSHSHRRIARILAAIEQQIPVAYIDPCSSRNRLLDALHQPVDADFEDIPLGEVVEFLSKSQGIPILIDHETLSDEGLSRDTRLSLRLQGRPLQTMLNSLLDELHLSYVIREGALIVTTEAAAEAELNSVLYNVKDLITAELTMDRLASVIETTTSGQWEVVNGDGGRLAMTQGGGFLLVAQTLPVQLEIQGLLDRLRRSHREASNPSKSVQHKLIVKAYRMPTEIAVDLRQSIEKLVEPESWKSAEGESPSITMVASKPQMDNVDGIVSGGTSEIQVINSNPENTKERNAEKQAKSVVLRSRSMLIIRQSPQVHEKIEGFLHKIGVDHTTQDLDPANRHRAIGHW
ncbi:MAG: permease prefix domain 1-containing protein [Planctomycetaceae bacterium]